MQRDTPRFEHALDHGTDAALSSGIMTQSNVIRTPEGKVVIARYNTFANASFAANRDGLWTVMGDVGELWNVTPRDARRLERAGYEVMS